MNFTRHMLCIHDLCQHGSMTLGPGLRYVIWTQGCPFHCEGCISPEARQITYDKQIRVTAMADDIISRPSIEGITISGGEPFLQAEALADLLDIVLAKRPELTVMSFTGYLKEDLSWPEALRLLGYLDLLVDGPYIEELNDNQGLRGSSNQRFHFLTPRLLPWKDELENGNRKVEYHVAQGKVKAFGVPSHEIINA